MASQFETPNDEAKNNGNPESQVFMESFLRGVIASAENSILTVAARSPEQFRIMSEGTSEHHQILDEYRPQLAELESRLQAAENEPNASIIDKN
jgi:hypothetical protein